MPEDPIGSPFGREGSAPGHVRLEGKGMTRLSLISHVIWWQILQQRVRLHQLQLGSGLWTLLFCQIFLCMADA